MFEFAQPLDNRKPRQKSLISQVSDDLLGWGSKVHSGQKWTSACLLFRTGPSPPMGTHSVAAFLSMGDRCGPERQKLFPLHLVTEKKSLPSPEVGQLPRQVSQGGGHLHVRSSEGMLTLLSLPNK